MLINERFLSFVKKSDSCWIWNGCISVWGYGFFGLNGKNAAAHRVSYQIFVGDIPKGMLVLHQCDNRACVNPAHLFLGTQKDNMQDMKSKGRHLHGSKSPRALLTDEQVAEIKATPKIYGSGVYLANKFNISTSQVSNIRAGKQWIHL